MGLISITPPRPLRWPESVMAVRAVVGAADDVYLVGGAVRDAYLHFPLHDIDLAVPDDGRPLARRLADTLSGAYYALDRERGVGRALIPWQGTELTVDVARFRGPDLRSDLSLRDFTLNAMAVPLASDLQAVIDPLGGLADLAARRLRQCSPESIATDPVRALRAVRASLAYNLRIERETQRSIRTHGPGLVRLSGERVRDEFLLLLGGVRPAGAISVLRALDLLRHVTPEAAALEGVSQSPPHRHDVWRHTLRTLEHLDAVLATLQPTRSGDITSRVQTGAIAFALDQFREPLQRHLAYSWPNGRSHRALLMLAALLHDAGKPATRSVDVDGRVRFLQHEQVGAELAEARASALKLSSGETARLRLIVAHHMRPHWLYSAPSLTPRGIYRFWRDVDEAGIDICLLALADYLAIYDETLDSAAWIGFVGTIETLLERYFHQHDTAIAPRPLLSGHELVQQLGIAPGPAIGELLAVVHEAQAAGEISTVEEALALARRYHASRRGEG